MILPLQTPEEAGHVLGERARTLRLGEDWTRTTLASRAGVTVASLKRFERTGKASLDLVLRVAHALGRLDEFSALLDTRQATTMAELERQAGRPPRQRGRT